MPDLDSLEQLVRLRDQGALTESEFEQQKARLLNADETKRPMAPWLLIAGAAVVVIVLALIVFSVSRQNSADIANVTAAREGAGTQPDNAVEAEAIAPVEEPTPGGEGGYQWATSQDMLGLNPAYVESKLGPAREKSATGLEYVVAGCRVYYGIKNGKLDYVTTDVSAKCHPNVDGKTLTERTTFRDVAAGGSLVADCVSYCGNAYDPSIDIFVPASHAGGFVQTLYTGSIGEPTSNAQEIWTAAIRVKHGVASDDYENSNADWFQCVADAPASVAAAMAPEKIDQVTFGYRTGSSCNYS